LFPTKGVVRRKIIQGVPPTAAVQNSGIVSTWGPCT
jgi:hypothetical protein